MPQVIGVLQQFWPQTTELSSCLPGQHHLHEMHVNDVSEVRTPEPDSQSCLGPSGAELNKAPCVRLGRRPRCPDLGAEALPKKGLAPPGVGVGERGSRDLGQGSTCGDSSDQERELPATGSTEKREGVVPPDLS